MTDGLTLYWVVQTGQDHWLIYKRCCIVPQHWELGVLLRLCDLVAPLVLIICTNTRKQRNWVFAPITNSDFLNPICLQPNVADLTCFKLWIMLKHKMLKCRLPMPYFYGFYGMFENVSSLNLYRVIFALSLLSWELLNDWYRD